MKLLTPTITKLINKNILQAGSKVNTTEVAKTLDILYDNIPDNKRISYGRVHTIHILTKYLNEKFDGKDTQKIKFAKHLFNNTEDVRVTGVGLGMITEFAEKDFDLISEYFLKAASNEHWEIREFAQMYFRKVIKKLPEKAHAFFSNLVQSPDPNIRRFVSEGLRPVGENRWFKNNPEYPISILKNLFSEAKPYPRSSVGNNLSDWARKDKEMVLEIVKKLIESGDTNSEKIAHRTCRNIVKKEPLLVLDILKTDIYKYKKHIYRRNEFE